MLIVEKHCFSYSDYVYLDNLHFYYDSNINLYYLSDKKTRLFAISSSLSIPLVFASCYLCAVAFINSLHNLLFNQANCNVKQA